MAFSRINRTVARKSFRASDIAGFIAGAVLLAGGLSTLVFVAQRMKPPPVELSAEEVLENARKAALKAALAHREGSILFVDPELCQEHTFDNWTGRIDFKEKVDCDARLASLRKSENDRAAERMRSVAEGFRR